MNIDPKHFCSSPWHHFRINIDGSFVPCRWMNKISNKTEHNVNEMSLIEFFNSSSMKDIRMSLLSGHKVDQCSQCYYEDQHNKLSGRIKSLQFTKIKANYIKSFLLSPITKFLNESYNNGGFTTAPIKNLQIDLGNVCNSGCIMCYPSSSSFLANEYAKLTLIQPKIFSVINNNKGWTDNRDTVNRFVDELVSLPDLEYVHLLGGETLFIKDTYTICHHLIRHHKSTGIIVGTTTNGTVYTKELEDLIQEFKEFHLGISIESVNKLNNYIRYPSDIDDVLSNVRKFIALRDKFPKLHLTLRITPTIFSIFYLDELMQFSLDNNVAVESCNILHKPSCLRIELLPNELRNATISKLNALIDKNKLLDQEIVVDIRNHNKVQQVLSNRIFEYKHFLESMEVPNSVNEDRVNLVKFLKAFESIRGNSILDYAPEFEEFLREYGY